MPGAQTIDTDTRRSSAILLPVGAAALLLVIGLRGDLTAAWGYGLFLLATVLITAGAIAFLIFMLTRAFDTAALRGAFTWLLRLGGWTYVLAIGAFSGFYVYEALQGRVEGKWMLFGPAILVAIVILDWGLYRLLIKKNLPTWQRFGHLVTRDASDPEAMRRTLIDDVVLHRSLMSISGFRWLKHTLIFWGFAMMFGVELFAVMLREVMPALGFVDIWHVVDHPVRLAFDFAYDATGLMVLVGTMLALAWRLKVNGTPEQKFTDTPTAAFLFAVALSGFVLEGLRIAEAGPIPTDIYSFVGYAFAVVMPVSETTPSTFYEGLWIAHVIGSCAFIAYVPVKRLVHSCATPMGRLMNSQKGLLAAKKNEVMKGLMGRKDAA